MKKSKIEMKEKENEKEKGFVILFAVLISTLILAVSLGVANIAVKEIKFGSSARDTNEAFFAADVGAECALYYDKLSPTHNAFGGSQPNIDCAGHVSALAGSYPTWSFVISRLGASSQACSIITIDKTATTTKITSKGYNNGGGAFDVCSPTANTVERQLEFNY